jgi:serine/threonine protein kinase
MEGKRNDRGAPTSDELDTASLDPDGQAVSSGVAAGVPAIGDLVAHKYQVESIIGRGGMGVVLGARHVQLRERVAIKVLLIDPTGRGAFTSRFLREAQVAAQLRNEHIARVADVGTLGDGTPYMVMEYVEGHDLHAVLRRDGKVPLHLAVEYVVQACEGLAEAHAQGVVHRDLKPPNLFLTHRADGSELIKILDFGISKLLSAEQPVGDLTETGVVMGSPKYMSPEQFGTAREVDTRADVWALGAIFYELATGTRAFDEPTLATLCARVISGVPPRSMRELCREASEALERAVLRCLRVERDERTADVAELAADLLDAVGAPDAESRTAKIRATLGRTSADKKARATPASVPKMTSVRGVRAATTPPASKPARPGTLLLEFGGPRESAKPVTEWRSTWITSSFQTLRERDLFKRYVEALPDAHRESLPLTVTGIWIPIATARVHYEACGRLGLSYTEARDLGLAVGERAQGSITRTAVALARTAGVDGWTLWDQGPRIWERGARGGAIMVYKAGPKEAVFEVIGCELFEVTYFRAALLGVILGMLRLVTNRAYAKELAREKNAFVARFQWV